jgi:hypothetical protein
MAGAADVRAPRFDEADEFIAKLPPGTTRRSRSAGPRRSDNVAIARAPRHQTAQPILDEEPRRDHERTIQENMRAIARDRAVIIIPIACPAEPSPTCRLRSGPFVDELGARC